MAYFHPEQKFTLRDICMMQSGGMTSVTGCVLVACTGVCCQNMNKWLWNAECSDVPKFVGPGKWKVGESKNRGLVLYNRCLKAPCSCEKGNATHSHQVYENFRFSNESKQQNSHLNLHMLLCTWDIFMALFLSSRTRESEV